MMWIIHTQSAYIAGGAATIHRELAKSLLPLIPTLVTVAETEQITDAAHILTIPQPTVSRQIGRAHALLGVELFERKGRGIMITAAGRVLIPYLERALAEIETGLDATREHSDRATGEIAIAFQNTLGEDVVPSLIKAFRVDHPNVVFLLDQGARARCLARLREGDADIAFVSLSDDPVAAGEADLASLVLYEEQLDLVVPADHPFASRRSISLAETAHESYVAMAHGFGMRSICEELWSQAGFTPHISFEGQDVHTLRGLVSAGLGISILPRLRNSHGTNSRDSGASVRSGAVDVRISSASARRHLGMIWLQGTEGAGAVRSFRTLVEQGTW